MYVLVSTSVRLSEEDLFLCFGSRTDGGTNKWVVVSRSGKRGTGGKNRNKRKESEREIKEQGRRIKKRWGE